MGNIVAAFFVKYNIPYIGAFLKKKKKWTEEKRKMLSRKLPLKLVDS